MRNRENRKGRPGAEARLVRPRWGVLRASVLAISVAFALWAGAHSQSQQVPGTQNPQGGSQVPGEPPAGRRPAQGSIFDDTPFPPKSEKEIAALNRERHKAMESDAVKLLRLATELKNEVEQANPGVLQNDEAQKAAQIEKLAHAVREKMSASFAP